MSPGFVPVLTGVALMTLAEKVLAVVQMVWKAERRPGEAQAVFNTAVLALSAWVAYGVADAVAPGSAAMRAALAIAPLYLLNAGIVTGALGGGGQPAPYLAEVPVHPVTGGADQLGRGLRR